MNTSESPGPPQRANWTSFSAAPHRLFFWSGVLYGLAAVSLWTLQQASLYTGLLSPLAWSVPFPPAHGFMMIFPLMGFYLFGFLLTTFPRWLDGEPVPRASYLLAWTALNLGGYGFWLGLWIAPWLVAMGCGLVAVGYLVATGACLRVLLKCQETARSLPLGPDRPVRPYQQWFILLGLLAGVAGILLAGYAFASGDRWAFRAARWVGLYPFLLQVVLGVVYRMVPFFTTAVTPGMELRRSRSMLPILAGCLWLRAWAGYQGWILLAWPLDLMLLILLARELVVWRFWRANFPPLLWILYLALGWFLLSFALSGGEGFYQWWTGAAAPPFRNAALHALTVGGFGGLLLGISTRVSLGHSGGGLSTDALLAGLFLAWQGVALARVLPEIAGFWWPQWGLHGFWSGIGWVAVFGLWFARVGPALMRPRSDGRPG